MGVAADFVARFFPIFSLGAPFGKPMDDSGAVRSIADWMTRRLGERRTVLAVVSAGALVTYGGVGLFVAYFVLAPMAHGPFRRAGAPRRLMPAAIMLGASTSTMSAMPGTPAIQNAIPMPFFGTTPFAAPGLGLIASAIMLGFGLWWLRRREAAARRTGEGYGPEPDPGADPGSPADAAADNLVVRERATVAREFDPAEARRGSHGASPPPAWSAALPIATVMAVNLAMSAPVLPGLDADFLAEERWGGVSRREVGGVWGVPVALACAIGVLVLLHHRRLPDPRASADAGANAAALPILSVASLVGFGAVVAALPAFAAVRDWVLGLGGGPLVSLSVATNPLAALTGSASGG